MSNTHTVRTCAEKVRNAALDDEKYNLRNIGVACIDRTCVVVMVPCTQRDAYRFGPR